MLELRVKAGIRVRVRVRVKDTRVRSAWVRKGNGTECLEAANVTRNSHQNSRYQISSKIVD